MPLVKPGRWSVNPADIDPEWLWAWRGLQGAFVFNEGSSHPFDVQRRAFGENNGDPAWIATPYGFGLSLDGAGDYVNLPNDQGLDFTSAYTLEILVNITRDSTDREPLLFRNSGAASDIEVYRQTAADSHILIVAHNRGNTGTFDFHQSTTMPIQQWLHLVITFVGGVVRVYYDAVQQSTESALAAPIDTDLPWRIGRVESFETRTAGMDVAKVAFYDRALTATEVERLYVDPFGMFRPALIVTEAGAVSGAGAITESSDNASGVGTILVSGSGAITELADDATGTGAVLVSGAGAISEQADTATGAGNVLVSGVGAVAEDPDDATGAGSTGRVGIGTITEGSDNATGAGNILVSGSGTITELSDNASGIGTTGAVSSGSVVLDVSSRLALTSQGRIETNKRSRLILQ